ncbi:MAG: PepSY domain-containing protein [Giesbergeria sp.]|jgi:hypothetical protein|nr:PepSY domain-containing protein [Giesbergeria sp.]
MKIATLLTSLALCGGLAVGGALLAPSIAGENRPALTGERQWLSIAQIHDKLEAAGYRNIEKIERERGGYEVRATDRQGDRIKLYVNPQTGEIMKQRGENRRQGMDAEGARQSADCNKRRCRDDLPPQSAMPASAAR